MAAAETMRLQKFLAHAGVCSRRAGEQLIIEGRVSVNGRCIAELGAKVVCGTDRVCVDGKPVAVVQQKLYVLLNKPRGYVTSCHHRGEKVVTDLVALSGRLFPVGRLDKDSTGLVLLTNDGRIHHRLLHPSFDHEKEYEVRVSSKISDAQLEQMQKGIRLKEGRTRPARVHRLDADRFRIVLQEGRNRQIRRMASALGHRVVLLHRIRMAHLHLGDLPAGQWRHLSDDERTKLLALLHGGAERRKGRPKRRS